MRTHVISGLVLAAAVAGCTGVSTDGTDDGTGVQAGTLDGAWKVYTAEDGGLEAETTVCCIATDGSTVQGLFGAEPFIGTVDGDVVEWQYDRADGWVEGSLDWSGPDELVGSYEVKTLAGSPPAPVVIASGTVRFVRHQTSGALGAGGEFSTTTDAWGECIGTPASPDLARVCLTTPATDQYSIVLELDPATSLAPGELAVSSDVTVTRTVVGGGASWTMQADGGRVTITSLDTTGIAGTFALGFDGGSESLSGSFDVPWDVVR